MTPATKGGSAWSGPEREALVMLFLEEVAAAEAGAEPEEGP